MYVTLGIHHELFYGKKCRMIQPSKQARHAFHCLVLNSHFIQLSECEYVLLVCLFVRLQISFIRCISDTLAGDFLSAQFFCRGKVELCHLLNDFCGEESKLFFMDVAYPEN